MERPKRYLFEIDSYFIMNRGVRKSSILGSLLFNFVFQVVLKARLSESNIGIELTDIEKNKWTIKHFELADDLYIITKVAEDETKLLNELQNYLETIGMGISSVKTIAMF